MALAFGLPISMIVGATLACVAFNIGTGALAVIL